MTKRTRELVLNALVSARGFVFSSALSRGRAGIEAVRPTLEECDRAIGALLEANSLHDAGAYARCSYCGRYSASPIALRGGDFADRYAPCDCGKGASGWCGSFESPGPDAQWSIGVNRAP